MFKKRDFWNNPYGGLVDFNNDGKEDFFEQYEGYLMFDKPRALYKQIIIKESNYPNKRRYNAACVLANNVTYYFDEEHKKRIISCCEFIIKNADKILAANYCTHNCEFIYSQAVKDNFVLPVSLPDEDETPRYSIAEIITKISKKDVDVSFKVWSWLVEQFLPHAQYTQYAKEELTFHIINYLYSMPDTFKVTLAHYFNNNPDFYNKIMSAHIDVALGTPELICLCIKEKLLELAKDLFHRSLKIAKEDWEKINSLVDGIITFSKNYSELETIEYFYTTMFPMIKNIDIGMVQDKIEEWDADITEYISYVEDHCEQYTFIRKNAWRKEVPEGSKYGIDPCLYKSENEYLTALNKQKYGWREYYRNKKSFDLDVDDYETQKDYLEAYNTCLKASKLEKQRLNKQELIDDERLYTLCGITFLNSFKVYHYKTDNLSIKIGDMVMVPVGDKECEGKVVSIGQYTKLSSPFPIEKIKKIISILPRENL